MATQPFQFVFDFDGTLTKKDTLHLVAEVGYKRQQAVSDGKVLPPWQTIVDAYMADYKAHATNYQPQPFKRKSIVSECNWLDSLQDVESASADRVIEAGIFNDVTRQDIENAAAEALKTNNVELRPGWAELLSKIDDVNAHILTEAPRSNMLQVVSVNWSRWFVWSIIWNSTHSLNDQTLRSRVQNALRTASIYANEVDSIKSESNFGPGSMPNPGGHPTTLRTGGDKLRHMQSRRRCSTTQPHPLQVYLGDSAMDLECLVMADVGICVRDPNMGSSQKDLKSTAERLGVQVKHLDEYRHAHNSAETLTDLEKAMSTKPKILYYVHDFYEVERWLTRVAGAVS